MEIKLNMFRPFNTVEELGKNQKEWIISHFGKKVTSAYYAIETDNFVIKIVEWGTSHYFCGRGYKVEDWQKVFMQKEDFMKSHKLIELQSIKRRNTLLCLGAFVLFLVIFAIIVTRQICHISPPL